ncbi:Phosphatidylglycerol-prolipoprotein diacylglyceryl transferase [Candidatus Glomeribacter gigasporarum BEG34]|uniref:Phosphatidylglycerol--prolipoprotein diacylglyceryl transferase n=1 Tax=Candidatus Glomeribacter gigasporarum BEG34 TaxID=1070319 RepID=G2JA57_9BURK|nr:prolipoprotein diacylglyceryl transferase [Candidatus Glomeribacter gigasporarum]CCD29657.1 Phosphatidylglycerol-prolipoprotein diacylglyceryl transferase [Candidatus Glomeribacter gigasporarum BEG34]
MLIHPQFNPIAVQIGSFAVHWYGLMYLVAFAGAAMLGRWRLRLPHVAAQGWNAKAIDDLLFYIVLGVVLGGRLGYALFYQASFYFNHPLEIFKVWQGGMSFHGGLMGVTAAMILYARRRQRALLQVSDFVAPLVPFGIAAGRFGNFINGELWGRVTRPDAFWAMLFPQAKLSDLAWLAMHEADAAAHGLQHFFERYHALPRHPSQLYAIALEGAGLFLILWLFARKPRPTGAVTALFLAGYGCLRFIDEFAREPDDFLGLLALELSMGQWLSLPMVAAGALLLIISFAPNRTR